MDWTDIAREDPAFLAPDRHAETLTRFAARRLREGRAAEAAALLHRRARLADAPAPAERALLALAASLAGRPDEAATTLAEAVAADPLDTTTGLIALRIATSPHEARAAAERLLASPLTPDDALGRALATLLSPDHAAVARLDLADGRLAGLIGWIGEPPVLVLAGPGGERHVALAPDPDLVFVPAGTAACFVSLALDHPADRWRLDRDGAVLATGALAPRSRHRAAGDGGRAPGVVPERRPVRIVMPVYADFDATHQALRAAVLETARHPGSRLVAVDDASPFPEITALLDAMAANDLLELRRNAVNLGFPGAVARGLEGIETEDALILNADAVLPANALARLADAVYSAPDIGTATPLANNGEWTSLPRLGEAAPSPAPPRAERLDAVARHLAGAPVDLPNGVGFALYVRHDCLAAMGGLPAIYERGYFEDLEWTLEARRAGFRNVAATNVFAVHHGSRSFGEAKSLLVARNLRRFRRRFPEMRAESAAFRKADPLRHARAAIERACPPEDAPMLLVAPAGSTVAAERLRRHRADGRPVVTLDWRRAGMELRCELRRTDGGAPQSLGFDAAREALALALWLDTLAPGLVELAGSPPPAEIADAVLRLDAAFVILAGDLPREPGTPAPLVAGFEGWRQRLGERWLQVVAPDPSTLAALRRHMAGDRDAGRIADASAAWTEMPAPAGSNASLTVVMGAPLPASARWVGELGAVLRTRLPAAKLTVLGSGADDLALLGRGIGASGRLSGDEFAPAARRAGACALVLPPSDPSLALFDRVAAETGLPSAQIDWSEGAAEPRASYLLLDRNQGERHILHAIVDWLARRLAA